MVFRIYVDTSVIGGCLDEEFSVDSLRLFAAARRGEKVLLVSDIGVRELQEAPLKVREVLTSLPPSAVEAVPITEEVDTLRDHYLAAGVVGPRSLDDAAHVAAATVARADAIVSWNFKHIVQLERIKGYNTVNLLHGYGMLTILSPREVQNDATDEF